MFRALRSAFVAVAVVLTAGPLPGWTSPAVAAVPPAATNPVRTIHTVTLITGDVVRLTTLADGRQVASVPSARHGYTYFERDGHVHVVPNDAEAQLEAGRLDEALFDVTALVRDGFDDSATTTLPLLVTGTATAPGTAAPGAAAPGIAAGSGALGAALSVAGGATRVLPSIGGVAVRENKSKARDFWSALAIPPGKTVAPGPAAAGVGKVWLDRKVHATLQDSVPQIGAPAAWKAGVDGSGVKVAVLDTGYDPTHPDLKGKVAEAANFTDEADTVDRFGHGTHVAATIAGSGTAGKAGGKGVAPGAKLLIGKVLDQSGAGDLSQIIAGMEWAVAEGARVVNVSIGAEAEDGPDPVSEAVDALTARSGTLFVVAAGNGGPGMQTVTTPGIAAAALTVGAVSKTDVLASFSGRGPRLGDGVVKPEITAPGVGIVAARAAGTSLGEIVDASYTSMSGTSMATPHVAGAAALLAQRHPDWKAAQLKAALVASAKPLPTAPAWAVGAGRVDVATALTEKLSVSPATVSFGRIQPPATPARSSTAAPATARSSTAGAAAGDPHDPSATLTYRNPGTAPVTLTLGVEARDSGATRKKAAVSVSPARLTVPAGGAATATVRFDAGRTAPNMYTGMVTASETGGRTLRTPLGAVVVPPTHTLTIRAVTHDGGAPGGVSFAELWNLDTGETTLVHFWGSPEITAELADGRYSLSGMLYSVDATDTEQDATAITDPEVVISHDRTIRFDGRAARPVRIDTPDPVETSGLGVAWQRSVGNRSSITGAGFNTNILKQVYVLPSGRASTGDFTFVTAWDLAAPVLTATVAGRGGFTLAGPRSINNQDRYDGRASLPLVDGGNATPAELARARGAVVLLNAGEATGDRVRAAAAAGAKLTLVAGDQPGYPTADAAGAGIPAYTITQEDGGRLRTLLAARGKRSPSTTGGVTLDVRGVAESPYRYDLLLPESGRVPTDVHYTARDLALATVETEFHGHAATLVANDERSGSVPGIGVTLGFFQDVTRPGVRVDHVNTKGVTWRHMVTQEVSFDSGEQGGMNGLDRTYAPGSRTREVWFPAIVRPGLPATTPDYAYGSPVNRAHDAIRVAIPQYASGDAGQYGWLDYDSDGARLTLRRNGVVVGSTTWPYAQFTVPGPDARYQLTLDVARDRFAPGRVWWTTSTATSTTWTFRSSHPKEGDPVVLPLLQLGYDLTTDTSNAVRADRPYPLVLRPGYQPGAHGRGGIQLQVFVSYNDGKNWSRVPTRGGAVVTATMPSAPRNAAFATLRVTARDRDGNELDQTITRAWKLR